MIGRGVAPLRKGCPVGIINCVLWHSMLHESSVRVILPLPAGKSSARLSFNTGSLGTDGISVHLLPFCTCTGIPADSKVLDDRRGLAVQYSSITT
jgi:hypothetical protein